MTHSTIFHKGPRQHTHARRAPPGTSEDPDVVLARLPHGTRNCMRVLGALLKKHNHEHAKKHKGVSFDTMLDRQRFLAAFFRELRRETQFHNVDPRQLGNRHIKVMVERWVQHGLGTPTIHKYLSILRTFAGWIGKAGMVMHIGFYVGADSPHAHRKQVATFDKSWSAKGIDIGAKVVEITAFDHWVGLQLELDAAFGLRSKEARHFRPHGAIIPRDEAKPRDTAAFPDATHFVRVDHGTKGGRSRDVPLTTAAQRELIERCCSVVAPGMFVGQPGKTSVQNQNRYYYVLRKFGICEAKLGVVAHGLRHQLVNDEYERDTGAVTPVRGGPARPVGDTTARERAATRLGHCRTQVVSCYIGAKGRGPESGATPAPNEEMQPEKEETAA
jgi:site-specific recombinase XerC